MQRKPRAITQGIRLSKFPPEIVLAIFGQLKWDTQTLASIARTCKWVQHDVYTVLYQYFSSSEIQAHRLFFRTLEKNPKTRLYVRTYVCPPIGSAIDNILSSPGQKKALATNAQSEQKRTLMDSILSALGSMVNLRALVMLNIGTNQRGVLAWLAKCAKVVSQDLEALAGNSHVIHAFMTNNAIRQVPRNITRIHIEPDAQLGFNSAIHDPNALRQPDALTVPAVLEWTGTLKALSLGGYWGRSRLTQTIAEAMPSLEYLEIIGPHHKQDLDAVPHFSQLLYLFMSSHSGVSGQPLNARCDDISKIVTTLFANCKKLQYIYIHERYRDMWAEYQVWHLGVKEEELKRIDELEDLRGRYMRWD